MRRGWSSALQMLVSMPRRPSTVQTMAWASISGPNVMEKQFLIASKELTQAMTGQRR